MKRMQHLEKYSDRLSRKGSRRSTEKARADTSRGNPRNTEKKKDTKNRRSERATGGNRTCGYLQTLQVRLRHGALVVSGFTALLEIASKLAACDTLREGPSAPPADEKFAPSQIPDFWDT